MPDEPLNMEGKGEIWSIPGQFIDLMMALKTVCRGSESFPSPG